MTDPDSLYSLAALLLFVIGLANLFCRAHPLHKIMAANIMASGIFLLLVATSYLRQDISDPVPQALVLTGIVVSVSTTALALMLACRIMETTNRSLRHEEKPSTKTAPHHEF